jgi:hypothetical protein
MTLPQGNQSDSPFHLWTLQVRITTAPPHGSPAVRLWFTKALALASQGISTSRLILQLDIKGTFYTLANYFSHDRVHAYLYTQIFMQSLIKCKYYSLK